MSLRCTHDLVSKFQFKRSPRWPIRHNLRFYSVPKIFESVSSDCAKELQPLPIAVNTITKSNILPLAWEYAANGSILWPSNLLARGLEILHSSTGLPWGLTLIAYTFALRSFLFPLSLRQTRSTILANNLKPQVQKLQMEAQTLREQGRQEESQRKIRELASFMSKKGINPVKILAFSFAPLPFFMATFFAVRNMASQPIASFLEERFLWLSDLSVADPYYILPAISTATLLLSLELSKFSSPNQNMSLGMQIGLKIFAAASLPVLSFMPSALVLYFCTSNVITCLIQAIWASKRARRFFQIPDIISTTVSKAPTSFFETFRDSYRAHLRDAQVSTTTQLETQRLSGRPPKVYAQKPKI